MSDSTFIRRVVIKNYRSIRACDLALGPLNFLVGPNGAGKSNFLDALRFVTDCLNTSVDQALRERGGVNEVRRRSAGHPTHFSIGLDFALPSGMTGRYAFRIGARSSGSFEIQSEDCELIEPPDHPVQRTFPSFEKFFKAPGFRLERGAMTSDVGPILPTSPGRLYLAVASSLPVFRPLFDALSNMGFYNLDPTKLRELQPPDSGNLLARDGWNLASVLGELARQAPKNKALIEEYLSNVVSGVEGVDKRSIGNRETLEFRQRVAGSENPWRFTASNMSDGTLRALGVLVAIFQRVPLVGIEEPEVALHPAALGVLLDALKDASHQVQVVVTSHSPDLLDTREIPADTLVAVSAEAGITTIGPVDEVSRSVLAERGFTPGELLRLNQLSPDPHPRNKSRGEALGLASS
jgi:predicted ATPase